MELPFRHESNLAPWGVRLFLREMGRITLGLLEIQITIRASVRVSRGDP